METAKKLITLGWREWLTLPELEVPAIKAKIDTGARTSALHTYKLEHFKKEGKDYVRFLLHPIQGNTDLCLERTARVIDRRTVKDSGGHKERRYVIETMVQIGDTSWPIEVTLTKRENMRFRMLLGRTAMKNRTIVNPALSFACGRIDSTTAYGL